MTAKRGRRPSRAMERNESLIYHMTLNGHSYGFVEKIADALTSNSPHPLVIIRQALADYQQSVMGAWDEVLDARRNNWNTSEILG